MRASKLRQRITVYKQTSGRSATGAVLPQTWSPFIVLWASIEPLSVKDVLTAQASGSHITARCILRYRNDINSTMQISHNDLRYDIDGDPLPDTNSGLEYMTLMLKATT